MARPRDLNPSPRALRVRAMRAGAAPDVEPKPPPLPPEDRTVDAERMDTEWPEVSATVDLAEALRQKEMYGARRARLAAMAEGLRLDQDRGKLWTSAQVRARDERWNAAVADRLDLVERLLDHVDGVTPEQRAAFLSAAREWRLRTKATLADVHG